MWIIEAVIPDTGEVRHLKWNSKKLTDKEVAELLLQYRFLCYNDITQRKYINGTYTCRHLSLH
jgi:hypothetical protein